MYLHLGILPAETIRRQSVVHVTNPKLAVEVGSLYDPRMGVIDEHQRCATCHETVSTCCGHFGHIDLNEPILHPLFITHIKKYIQCICLKCGRLLCSASQLHLAGIKQEFQSVYDFCIKMKLCFHCETKQPKYKTVGTDIEAELDGVSTVLSAYDVLAVCSNTPGDDIRLLGVDPELTHPSSMVLTALPVLPPASRPYIMIDKVIFDDDLTIQLQEIIKINKQLGEPLDPVKRAKCIQNLIFRVSTFFDNGKQKAKHTANGRAIKGLKDRMVGKQGLMRNNLMGKRCDQTARTVIGPDPTLRLDQLGIPPLFAETLTIPELVNSYNKKYLTRVVNEGKAKFIIRNGNKISISFARSRKGTTVFPNDTILRNSLRLYVSPSHPIPALKSGDIILRNGVHIPATLPTTSFVQLKEGDIVERHLKEGDIVLLNRQPTLHKGSMLAKYITILPTKTLKFNLATTKPFNADFDGDEMNIHIPQSYESRAELEELMGASRNIMSCQAGKPYMAIVQDSLLACYLMTTDAEQVPVPVALYNDICMWVDDAFSKIDYISSKVIDPEHQRHPRHLLSLIFPPTFSYTHETLCIKEGIIMSGTLTKQHLGSSSCSILTRIHHNYGVQVVSTFINEIQFVANQWLVHRGFSIGLGDCIQHNSSVKEMTLLKYFKEASIRSTSLHHKGVQEMRIQASLGKATTIGKKLAKDDLKSSNGFLATVLSGSKGDFFNITQIMGLLGQQLMRGQRIQKSLSKGTKSLPIASPSHYEERGFVKSSFMEGLSSTEFYFHAMCGREGVSDTALKTATSGYSQRRIVKLCEDIQVGYDGTVVDTYGNVYRFAYGQTGFDTSISIEAKLKHLTGKVVENKI